jgi:hypothetical protein
LDEFVGGPDVGHEHCRDELSRPVFAGLVLDGPVHDFAWVAVTSANSDTKSDT